MARKPSGPAVREIFEAKLWQYQGKGGWHFVTLPIDLAQRLRRLTEGERRPFGSFQIEAKIGPTSWSTSLFADTKAKSFLLPVKHDVRKKAKIAAGDTVKVEIGIDL